MALSKIFKKNSAPEELPDLAIDELKKEIRNAIDGKKEPEEETEKLVEETKTEENEKVEEDNSENKETESEEKPTEQIAQEEPEERIVEEEPEREIVVENKKIDKSFFNPMITELKKENFDPAKINKWYNENFSRKSAVEGMKDYWEKKKEDFIIETVEKEFRSRINERISHLQELEMAWQEIYIKLLEKEEEMKKEETNIKKLIKDFSEVSIKKKAVKKNNKEANHEKKETEQNLC